MTETLASPSTLAKTPARSSQRFGLLRQVARRPAGAISLSVVLIVVAAAVFASLVAPYDPNAINIEERFANPSWAHPLGQDYLGRDILSRLIYGARLALQIAIPAIGIAFIIGLTIGLISGYIGGVVDSIVSVFVDAVISMPAIILGLALLALLGPSVRNIVLVIAIAATPYYARLSRAQVLAVKQQPYIRAERALGVGRIRIISRHILPNILPPLLIVVAMDIPGAIGTEAALALLGLGVQRPTPDWGVMIGDGFTNASTYAWPLVSPLLTLVMVTAAFVVLGETIRDLTDPKFQGSESVPRRWRRSRRAAESES